MNPYPLNSPSSTPPSQSSQPAARLATRSSIGYLQTRARTQRCLKIARQVSRIFELPANGNSGNIKNQILFFKPRYPTLSRGFRATEREVHLTTARLAHRRAHSSRTGQVFSRSKPDLRMDVKPVSIRQSTDTEPLDKLEAWKRKRKSVIAPNTRLAARAPRAIPIGKGAWLLGDMTTHHHCTLKLPDQLHFCLT